MKNVPTFAMYGVPETFDGRFAESYPTNQVLFHSIPSVASRIACPVIVWSEWSPGPSFVSQSWALTRTFPVSEPASSFRRPLSVPVRSVHVVYVLDASTVVIGEPWLSLRRVWNEVDGNPPPSRSPSGSLRK